MTRLKTTMIFLLSSTWYLLIVYLKLHIKLKVKSWNWPKYVFIWRMHDSNHFIGFNCTLPKYIQPTNIIPTFSLFSSSSHLFKRDWPNCHKMFSSSLFSDVFQAWVVAGARTNRMMINGIVFHVPCWHSPKGRKKKQSRSQYRVWRENMDIQ